MKRQVTHTLCAKQIELVRVENTEGKVRLHFKPMTEI